MDLKTKSLISKLLYLIPAAHILIWVVLPSMLEGSLRLDAAEGMTGGPEWQLSYPKHPPFSEWLIALAWYTGPIRYSALYLISQLLAAGSIFLIARWLLSIFGAVPALIALCAGLASPFTTYIPVQLNHNIGVMPFWALVIITAWNAFNTNKIFSWLLFGVSVGLGLWAKYSIFHLVAALGVVFFSIPKWRQQIFGAGPWIAALTAIVIIAPHGYDVLVKGSSTFNHAINHVYLTPREVFGFTFNMLLNSTILFLFTSVPFVLCVGFRSFSKALIESIHPDTASPRDWFLFAATFGPIVLLVASPFLGIRPRPLWITPLIIPLVIYFANILSRIENVKIHRALVATGVFSSLLIFGYISTIIVPIQNEKPQYSNLDHRKILRDAQEYWRINGSGRIVYIVQTQRQRAMHTAGSIAFDLPYKVHVFDQASVKMSPWIRPNDVTRRGALVIGSPDIPDDFTVNAMPVVKKATYQAPTIRGRSRLPVTFGVIEAQIIEQN